MLGRNGLKQYICNAFKDSFNLILIADTQKIRPLLRTFKVSIFLENFPDSVAQLVEHIPFKDGVLGSNPS